MRGKIGRGVSRVVEGYGVRWMLGWAVWVVLAGLRWIVAFAGVDFNGIDSGKAKGKPEVERVPVRFRDGSEWLRCEAREV